MQTTEVCGTKKILIPILTFAKGFFWFSLKVIYTRINYKSTISRRTQTIISSFSFHRLAVVMVACRGAFPLQPPCLSRDTTIILLAKTWVVVNLKHEPWLQLSGVTSRQATKHKPCNRPRSLPLMRRRVASARIDARESSSQPVKMGARAVHCLEEAFTPLPLQFPHP